MYIQWTVLSPWLSMNSTKPRTAHQDGKGHWHGIDPHKPFPSSHQSELSLQIVVTGAVQIPVNQVKKIKKSAYILI